MDVKTEPGTKTGHQIDDGHAIKTFAEKFKMSDWRKQREGISKILPVSAAAETRRCLL